MTDATEIVHRYLAVWNEPDADSRRGLIAAAFTEDATYVDPVMRGEGHAGLATMIDAALEQFFGYQFVLRGEPEGHNDRVRFSWSLAAAGAPAVAHGTDLVVIAEDGRIRSVTGFLDPTPAESTGSAGWTADDFARFWASPDFTRIGTGIASDAVAYWPGRDIPIRGVEAYVRPLRALLERVPDFRLEVVEHASNEESVFIRWIARGTAAGQPIEFTGVDIVRHRDGQVIGNRIFCDHPLIREVALV